MIDEDVEDFLAHFGVKGMRWGVRKDRPDGVSAHTNREAKKDAKEFARAKMFYGADAGNRRKLIKASVEAKTKRDPSYKKAFDHHLSRQDMSEHASKARVERKRTDRGSRNKQRAGALARTFTGEMGTQAAFVAVALGGAAYIRSGKGRQHMNQAIRFVNSRVSEQKRQRGAQHIADFLKRQGL